MAEDLALYQVTGNGRAIEHDQGLILSRTEPVQGFCTHLLSRTALAGNKDGRPTRRCTLEHTIHCLHGQGVAYKAAKFAAVVVFFITINQITELLMFDRITHRGAKSLVIKGFGQKIKSALTHGIHGDIDRTMGGNHQNSARQVSLVDKFEDFHAGDIR